MNDTETKPDIEAKPETKAKAWPRPNREKTIAERRSLVRVWVTKMAALYIFLGSATGASLAWR